MLPRPRSGRLRGQVKGISAVFGREDFLPFGRSWGHCVHSGTSVAGSGVKADETLTARDSRN